METERTTLTLLQESDLPVMTAMSKEPDTFRYIRKLRVMNDEQYQQFLLLKLEQIRSGAGYHWAVRLKGEPGGPGGDFVGPGGDFVGPCGDFVGAVNLNPIGGTKRLQIGCQLMRKYWGQGFASELLKWVRDFAIHDAGLSEVFGVFEKDNIVSRRLLAKLGFVWIEDLIEPGIGVEVHRYAVPG